MPDDRDDLADQAADLGLALLARAVKAGERLAPGDARAEALLESAVRQLRRSLPLLGSDDRHLRHRVAVRTALAQAVASRPWRHDVGEAEDAREHLEAALREVDRSADPDRWGLLQHNLGVSYQNRVVGDIADNRERAVRHLEAALSVQPLDRPDQRAITLSQLGNAYNMRLRGDREDNVDRAIAKYGEALQLRRPDRDPVRWGITMHNLGIVFMARRRGDRQDTLRAAIDCFTRALTVRTRERYPEFWAMTSRELGTAYVNLGDPDAAATGERYLQDALTVYTRERVPGEWATIQLSRALAAEAYGDLAAAQEILRPVLVLPLEHDRPQLWARVAMVSGRVEFGLAVDAADVSALERSVSLMRRAVDRLMGDGELTWARTAAVELANRLLITGQYAAAADVYQIALDADARQYAASLSLDSRQIELRASQGVAANAALALAFERRLGDAVDVLERSRGRMLGEALSRDRAELGGLLNRDERGRAAAERFLAAASRVRALEGHERHTVTE